MEPFAQDYWVGNRAINQALLSYFSRVRLCVTSETVAHQAPRPWDSPGENTGVGCHFLLQCMKVKSESEVAQSCPTFHNPMDCSLPGSSVHGIFQARVLEWGAIAFSRRKTYLASNVWSWWWINSNQSSSRGEAQLINYGLGLASWKKKKEHVCLFLEVNM